MSVYNLATGTQCYKFKLQTLISNPATSQTDVWLAEDEATKTQVALKVIAGAPNDIPSRLYEARVGAKFKHNNLCEVVGADVVDIPAALVNGAPPTGPFVLIGFMYQPNGSCTRLLEGPGVLRVDIVHKLLLDVLAGLEYLHEQGLQHNDIKPANILLNNDGNFLLTDYGITWSGAAPTVAPVYMPHMAPESLQALPAGYTNNHRPCAATDIYQLGLTAYRLLNGADKISGEFDRHASAGTLNDFFAGVIAGNIPDRSAYGPEVPQRLRQIINKALEISPGNRYSSALEMRRDVERIHYPCAWGYDAANKLVLEKGNAVFTIERTANGRRFDVAAVAQYSSGKVVRPKDYRATNLTGAQADAHIKKIMQQLMKQ